MYFALLLLLSRFSVSFHIFLISSLPAGLISLPANPLPIRLIKLPNSLIGEPLPFCNLFLSFMDVIR